MRKYGYTDGEINEYEIRREATKFIYLKMEKELRTVFEPIYEAEYVSIFGKMKPFVETLYYPLNVDLNIKYWLFNAYVKLCDFMYEYHEYHIKRIMEESFSKEKILKKDVENYLKLMGPINKVKKEEIDFNIDIMLYGIKEIRVCENDKLNKKYHMLCLLDRINDLIIDYYDDYMEKYIKVSMKIVV